jgi:subtilisin-like proprotein convertase family protein
VTNTGDTTARRVSVTVTTPVSDVTVDPAIKQYGSIKPGSTRVHSYRVTLPRSAPLGSRVPLSIRVRFSGGLSPQSGSGSLDVGQPSTSVVTARYTGPDVAIPDGTPAGASVPLDVADVGPLSRVAFSIDGSECSADQASSTVGLQHSFVGDLIGTLRGPDGTTVTLFDRTGGVGNNFCRTVFTDSAARAIQGASSTAAPFTGDWRPAEPLAAFRGHAGDGTWTFTVSDLLRADTGVLRAVSLNVSGFVPPPER